MKSMKQKEKYLQIPVKKGLDIDSSLVGMTIFIF